MKKHVKFLEHFIKRKILLFLVSVFSVAGSMLPAAASVLCDDINCLTFWNQYFSPGPHSVYTASFLEFPSGYRPCYSSASDYQACLQNKEAVIGQNFSASRARLYFQDGRSVIRHWTGIVPPGEDYVVNGDVTASIESLFSGGSAYLTPKTITPEIASSWGWSVSEFKISDCVTDVTDVLGISITPAPLVGPSCLIKGDAMCFYMNGMVLGCYYSPPPMAMSNTSMASKCIDASGQRIYGYMKNADGTSTPIMNPLLAKNANDSSCKGLIAPVCYTMWQTTTINGVTGSGHPFSPYITGKGTSSSPYNLQGSEMTGKFIMSDFHVTAPLMDCALSTLASSFGINVSQNTYDHPTSPFPVIQASLRKTVTVALVLFIIAFATKTALSTQIRQADLYLVLLKFAGVSYVVLGDGAQQLYPALVEGALSAAQVIMDSATNPAGNSGSVCNQLVLVANGSLPDPRHVALWDMVDCKLYAYLGFADHGFFGILGVAFIMCITAFPFGALVFIILMITLVLMGAFILKAVYLFFLGSFALVMLIFVAPLFVPCILFSHPVINGLFRSWLAQTMGCCLYPVISFAFLALALISVDTVMYGSSILTTQGTIDLSNCDINSFACAMGKVLATQTWMSFLVPFLGVFSMLTWLDAEHMALLKASINLALVSYVFYHLGEIMEEFTRELAGTMSMSSLTRGTIVKAPSIVGGAVGAGLDKLGSAAFGKDDKKKGTGKIGRK